MPPQMKCVKHIFGFIVAALLAARSHAQCSQYSMELSHGPDCGIIGVMGAVPRGINELGQIVGFTDLCSSAQRACRRTSGPFVSILNLGPGVAIAEAKDINAAGQITGWVEYQNGTMREGFLYENGVVTLLGVLPGANYVEALAINEKGQIAGYVNDVFDGPLQAFIWENSVMEPVPETEKYSVANDINNVGDVTGWMDPTGSFFTRHAFIRRGGKTTDLGPVPDGVSSFGTSVNDLGEVCGWGIVMNPDGRTFVRRAFKWAGGRMTSIDPLPGFTESFALGINNEGVVVGYCRRDTESQAFLWRDGVIYSISDLVPDRGGLLLTGAWAINHLGQIAAQAVGPGVGYIALLTPIPAQGGDCTCDGIVDVDDLFAVIDHWGMAAPNPADFDHDGIVDAPDLFVVIENWSMP